MRHKRSKGKPETVKVGNVTVKVYRRERPTTTGQWRTIYEVCDYTAGVRRLRGFSEHGEARREAQRIAGQLATGDATAAQMLGSEAASYGRAVELLRPTGASLELASAIYAKAFEILGSDRILEAANFYRQHGADNITPRTVAQVVQELLEAKTARTRSERYLGDLRSRLGQFAQDFQTDIGSITTPDVQHWLDGLKVAPNTARGFRTLLFGMFRFAESRGYVHKGGNVVADVERIEVNSDGDIEIYSPTELTALLKAAPKAFLPVVTLAGFAGVRTAEIMRLEWHDLDLAGGFLTVAREKSKTRSRRIVPVAPCLAAWLAPYSHQKGRLYKGDRHELAADRDATVKAAGVPWKPNALRHSFCSYRLAQTQDVGKVSLEAGNSPAMIFRHYRELVRPEAARTWFAVTPEQPENVVTLKTEAAQ
jgi:integrase